MAPKIPDVVKCDSLRTLDHELEHVRRDLSLTESEDTWDKIARSMQYLEALTKGTSHEVIYELVAAVKSLARPINNALLSDRSRLSGHATDFMTTLASNTKKAFEPLISSFVPTLLLGCARSNKVFITKSKTCLMAIVEHVQSPHLLPHFRTCVTDKSLSLRLIATELVLSCMLCFNPPDLETAQRAEDIEAVIRATATDASAEVRKCSRSAFDAYRQLLPKRLDSFVDPMTPTMKRYLNVTNKEKPAPMSSSMSSSRGLKSSGHKPTLTSSRSTREVKKSDMIRSTTSNSEAQAIPVKHESVEKPEHQFRRERAPATGPVRPPFASREAASSSNSHTTSATRQQAVQQSLPPARPGFVHLTRMATSKATEQAYEATIRTGARRPDPVFKRPVTPDDKGDAVLKSGVLRPEAPLTVEDLRKPSEDRPKTGPRRVMRPPPPDEPKKAKESSSSGKPASGVKREPTDSANATNPRRNALKAKLEAQAPSGVTERRPVKAHTRAASQPATMLNKDKKVEVKKQDPRTRSPPAPRSAPVSSRPGLTQPTLAQLARMKETANEAKSRPVKTFTKTVKGARAVIKPLTIRKRKRKSSVKKPDVIVLQDMGEVCESDAQSEYIDIALENTESGEPTRPTEEHDDDNVVSPTEDEPTIREIAVPQSPVITPPPDSLGSSSGSCDGETTSRPQCEMRTPPRALFPAFPPEPAATPISALLFSIEQGFVAATPSQSVLMDDTLPYSNDIAMIEDDEDDDGSVLKNIEFAMNQVECCKKKSNSPHYLETRSPLGLVDTNCA